VTPQPNTKALKLQKEFIEPHMEVSIPHGAYILTQGSPDYFLRIRQRPFMASKLTFVIEKDHSRRQDGLTEVIGTI
jgi:hypothetical protein